MSVPEGLVRLLPDLCVSGGEHQQHAEHHHVSSDTADLSVMYLHRRLFSYLRPFDVEKAVEVSAGPLHCRTVDLLDIVSGDMENGPEEQRVCNLSVEPLGFIQWQYPDLRSYPSQHIFAHRKHNDRSIDRQGQTGTSRYPY